MPGPASDCSRLNGPPPFEDWDETTAQYNNCYNYALNIATGKMSEPGRWKGDDGHPYENQNTQFTCDYVRAGCELDGLTTFVPGSQPPNDDPNSALPPCGENCHRIALYVRPHEDGLIQGFHFARQDQDGTWSMKWGPYPATRIMVNGAPMTHPRQFMDRTEPNAYRPRDWIFCGTYCVCRCQVHPEKEGDKTRWREEHPGHHKKAPRRRKKSR
jgi:hypothetical protein